MKSAKQVFKIGQKTTVKELKAIAKELGLKGYSRLRKDELIAKIAEVKEKETVKPKTTRTRKAKTAKATRKTKTAKPTKTTRKARKTKATKTKELWYVPIADADKITAINPRNLTYKKNGVTVKVTPIANNGSRNKNECKLMLEQAKIAITKYRKYIDFRTCKATNVIEFFIKDEYSKSLGYWDYLRGKPSILADLDELPRDLHKPYLDIIRDVCAMF